MSIFDGSLTEGRLYPVTTTLSTSTQRFTGTMGPSVENIEVDEFAFEVGADAISIKANLGWSGGVDIDFSLVDPAGNEVASGASLANPETLEFAVTTPGTYKYLVKGFATVIANYTLDSTITTAQTNLVQEATHRGIETADTRRPFSCAPLGVAGHRSGPRGQVRAPDNRHGPAMPVQSDRKALRFDPAFAPCACRRLAAYIPRSAWASNACGSVASAG